MLLKIENELMVIISPILTLKTLQFDPPCGFSKNVSSRASVKP